jgi:predicted nucleic acid-binding protein
MVRESEMPEVFADTSGWGSLVDPTQPFHAPAAILYRQAREQGHKVVTTNYILTELIALLTSPLRIPRSATVAFIDGLKTSPYVEVVHIDLALDGAAWQLLKKRPDKEWSLVDCASFVLMQQRGILEALTTDHHFEQAGFVRLLK